MKTTSGSSHSGLGRWNEAETCNMYKLFSFLFFFPFFFLTERWHFSLPLFLQFPLVSVFLCPNSHFASLTLSVTVLCYTEEVNLGLQ